MSTFCRRRRDNDSRSSAVPCTKSSIFPPSGILKKSRGCELMWQTKKKKGFEGKIEKICSLLHFGLDFRLKSTCYREKYYRESNKKI